MRNEKGSGTVDLDSREQIFNEITNLLLVEPEIELQDALKVHLNRLGFQVTTVTTGQRALEILKNQSTGVLISDIHLPDMEGTDLIRLAKAVSPNTAIIMIGNPEDRKGALNALRLNVTDFLHKPVESDILEIALGRAAYWRSNRVRIQRYAEQLEALHQTKVLFQQLFDEVPCYISIQDKNFRLTGANRRFKEDFGDAIGAICYEIYKHREQPCSDCPVMDTFKDGMPHQTEEVVTTRSGKTINVLTWTAPITNPDGEITEVIEMATDITQIRKLQDRLTSIGLMMSSISHSIKGILTALDGGIYKLESGLEKDDPERLRAGVALVKEMVEKIRKIVMNVLYYTKERELELTTINVNNFTNDLLSLAKPKADASGINIESHISPDMGTFEIDPNSLRSALINILENCIEACVDDPDKNKEHSVALNVRSEEDTIVYEIKDNGIGMDRETAEKVFTLFFSSKGSRGTGLGMYVANQIIQQHGGTIEVESEKGKGSTFFVRLPRTVPRKTG